VDEPLRLIAPTEVFRKLEALDPTPIPDRHAVRIMQGEHAGSVLRVRAAIYPEEVRWRGDGVTTVDAWLAAVEVAPPALPTTRQSGPKSKTQLLASFKSPKHYLVRPGRVGREDMLARAPELRPLQSAHIVVIGLGCLGAPSALEFARAQVGMLTLADYDLVDPGTSVRWPFGLQAAGFLKSAVLQDVIRANYPYTVTRAMTWRVGGLRADEGEHEGLFLRGALESANLIYDASAEPGVRFFLSEVARDRRIPYIGIAATQGGWGGWIIRIRPDGTEGCLRCLEFAFADEPNAETYIAWPPADKDAGAVQPVGCADPTFRATGFDVAQVTLMGVRMAVGTLTAGEADGYPDGEWDVAVLRLRNDVGDVVPPTWATYALPRHPKCGSCAARVAA
jgi:molybdopterin/thiamine biosynthesis adenylyltransferase